MLKSTSYKFSIFYFVFNKVIFIWFIDILLQIFLGEKERVKYRLIFNIYLLIDLLLNILRE